MKMTYIHDRSKKNYSVITPGKHLFFFFNYSGKINIDIQSAQAEVYIFGMYVGKNNDQFNLETIQHHIVGNTISDLFVRGVFFDASKFLYEGLITIDKKAQQSNAYQKNQNLIMSKEAFVDSRPFLEIQANDVRCTHGSTTGRIDKEQSYYLEARGIEKKRAEKLLIEGFIEEIFIKIREIGPDTQDKMVDTLHKKVLKYL